MDKLLKFFPLVKVDEATRMVYGLVTAQAVDKDGEVCEYASTKPEYEKVNAELGKASGGENIMPLREMHQLNAVGAGKSIEFDDARKQIRMAFKVVDDSAWKKVTEKVLLGFSQGGRYLKRWKENGQDFYTAQPGEVSLVDNPCLPGAFIEYAKADGTVELFKTKGPSDLSADDLKKLIDGLSDSLSTRLAKTIKEKSETVEYSATGEAMKPEEIKKCAAALGITEEEFTKKYVEGDALEKGSKGLAALHSHLKKAVAHHGKMEQHHAKIMEMHKAHAEMHGQMADHLENCMKAHGACMDGAEAEKVLKALGIEENSGKVEGATPESVQKLIDEAIAKTEKSFQEKLDKLPEAPKAKLFSLDRGEEVKKAVEASDPLPV